MLRIDSSSIDRLRDFSESPVTATPGQRERLWSNVLSDRQLDAAPNPVSMRNDSALASRWFWSLCHGVTGGAKWIHHFVRTLIAPHRKFPASSVLRPAIFLQFSPFNNSERDHDSQLSGEKTFSPVEPQGGLSFLFRLSAPRFA
jgi:hypothetical protein